MSFSPSDSRQEQGDELLPVLEPEYMVGSPTYDLEPIDTHSVGPTHKQLPLCNMQVFPVHGGTAPRSRFPYLGACISEGQGCIVTGEFLQFAYEGNMHKLQIEPVDENEPEIRFNIEVKDAWGKDHTIQIGGKSKIPFLLKTRRLDDNQEFLFRLTLPCLVTPENCFILPGPTSAQHGVVMWIGCHSYPLHGIPAADGFTQVASSDWLVQCDHRITPTGFMPFRGPSFRISGCPDEVILETDRINSRGGLAYLEGQCDGNDTDDSTDTVRPGPSSSSSS